MPSASNKVTAVRLRSCRVSLIRKRVQYLGFVTAPDPEAAKAAAVKQFKLSAEQRRRLLVQERTPAVI
jgi:hypothetical protein